MNRTTFILHPNGTITETHHSKKDELEILQEAVGGYIERVSRENLNIHNEEFKNALRGVKHIFCCEDGRGLPINPHFTLSYKRTTYILQVPFKGAIAFTKNYVA